jgi:hypothetical protein
MFDYRLRFDSEEQAKSVLYRTEGVVFDEEGNITDNGYEVQNYDMIDIIGAIYKPTGETDEEGNPVMVDVGGYHANVRNFTPTDTLDAYLITPQNPVRKWAGS